MKYSILLLAVVFLTIVNVNTAKTVHSPPASQHHVVKHVTSAKDGHSDAKKDSKHDVHKHATTLEKSSAHDHEHGKKGEKVIKNHKIVDEEKGGKKSKSHSSDAHQSHKHVQNHSALGAKVKAAVRQRKNNYSKGFREQYHKNEHKKHDTFYSNGQKSGEFKAYGTKNQKYDSHHHIADKHAKTALKKHAEKHGRDGKNLKENKTSFHKGHQSASGDNKYKAEYAKWGKKNGKSHHDEIKELGYLPLK